MLHHFIKTLKRKAYLIVAVVIIAAGFNLSGGFAHLSYADTACPNNLSSLSSLGLPAYCNVVGTDSTGLLTHVINLLLALLGVIAVLFIIIGGYRMVTSNGDEKNFEKGQKTVTYAVIGLVVAVLAFTIITVIGNTIGSATNSNSGSSSSQSTANNTTNNANSSTATTNGSSSTSSNGTTSTSSNGSTANNNSTNQATPIPASSPNCTATTMQGINIVIIDPTPVYVDPTNGGKVQYEITPDNDAAAGCQVSIDTYILEGPDTWNASLQPNDTASGFGSPNTLTIPEQYSQDPSITLYSRFTDSTGAVKDDTYNLSLTQTSQSSSANSSCTAAAMGRINISAPSSATVDPTNGGSIEYTLTPDNSSAAGCQITINTYILEGSDTWNPSLEPNDTATGFGTNTLTIPEQYSQDPSITIYSMYTDSTGASIDTSKNLNIIQPPQDNNSNDNSSDTSNDGSSDTGGSYDGGD